MKIHKNNEDALTWLQSFSMIDDDDDLCTAAC
jgi:hypothetical protein